MASQLDSAMYHQPQRWADVRCRSERQIRAIKSFGRHSPSAYSALEEQTWTPEMQFVEAQYFSIMAEMAAFKREALEDLVAKIGELARSVRRDELPLANPQ